MPSPRPTTRIIIDTDPAMGSAGGDPEDSFAILLALHSPELVVEGLTVVQGNVPVDHGYANAVHLLELLGRRDVPVCSGVATPLDPRRRAQLAWLEQRGGLERLAPPASPSRGDPDAVDFLIQTVRENPDEITLVAIGPLSNVARAIEREPSLARQIRRVVMMGGAANVPGNITPAAEFNIWADPEAASRVFECGAPITMVGLDVCEQTHLHEDAVQPLAEAPSELARFVARAVQPWIDLRRGVFGANDLHLYDSLAAAVAFRPDLVRTEEAFVAVETEGAHTAGATVAYLNPILRAAWTKREPNADVALEVKSGEFEALFDERVLAPLAQGFAERKPQ
jgi:inosine-uridine nucleoside N-ribohydrolase